MESDKAGGRLLLLGLITISASSFFSMFCPAELKLKPFCFLSVYLLGCCCSGIPCFNTFFHFYLYFDEQALLHCNIDFLVMLLFLPNTRPNHLPHPPPILITIPSSCSFHFYLAPVQNNPGRGGIARSKLSKQRSTYAQQQRICKRNRLQQIAFLGLTLLLPFPQLLLHTARLSINFSQIQIENVKMKKCPTYQK